MAHQNASSEGDHDNITWLDPVRDMEALEVQDRDDVCTMVRLQNNMMASSVLFPVIFDAPCNPLSLSKSKVATQSCFLNKGLEVAVFGNLTQPSVTLKIKDDDAEMPP